MNILNLSTQVKMDAVLTAVKDLAKFKIIASISTGDKTYDNLLSGMMITLLTYVFSWQLDSYLKLLWYKNKETFDGSINSVVYTHYSLSSNQPDLTFYEIQYNNKNKDFYSRVMKYMFKKIGFRLKSSSITLQFNETGNMNLQNNQNMALTRIMTYDKIYPICLMRKYHIYAKLCGVTGNLMLGCVNYDFLQDFSAKLVSDQTLASEDKPIEDKKKQCCIIDATGQYVCTIPPDRRMEFIVTRHKPIILRALDNFVKVNKADYQHTILTSYNLGFIFYGAPGTGKTSLIKAIANYLNMHIRIVNLSKTNTLKELQTILSDPRYVIVFEEFDFMQGALTRDGAETNDLKIYQEKLMSLMKEKCQIKEEKALKTFDDEIEKVKKQIADAENKITLDGFLTALDGLVETRGRVIIATTNYIDKIDSALIREGRFDYKLSLDKFNDTEIKELLTQAFPDDSKLIDDTAFLENTFTPVQITNMCKIHHDLPIVLKQLRQKTRVISIPEKTD